MYKELIRQIHMYAKVIQILARRYLPTLLVSPLKLKEILNTVKVTSRKMNLGYDLVTKILHLYYDMR